MGFEEMNHYKKMELPENREPGTLDHQNAKKAGFKAKNHKSKTVSLTTYKRSLQLVGLIIFLAFVAGVAYGLTWVFDAFVSN